MPRITALRYQNELSNEALATTTPSSAVTDTATGLPSASRRSQPAPVEPCQTSRSSWSATAVGRASGPCGPTYATVPR